MGKLPAVLVILSLFSMLSVIYFSIKTRNDVIRTQRLQHRDNLRYPLTDGDLGNPTMNSDSVTSIRINKTSTVLAVPAASAAGSTPWHSVHGRKTPDTGLAIHKLTNQSLERVTEAHFKGMSLQSHLHQTDSLTAVPPSVNKQLTLSNSSAANCSDSICSQYLSRSDRSYFSRCQSMARIDPFSDKKNAQCRFMDGRGRDPVALVSVPGAGNTWVRSLIEKASGICTGAIYCDQAIRKGLIGEYVHSGSVIVVKTHTSDYQWKGGWIEKRNHEDALYGSAILLIRSPFDTFVSERNRVVTLRQLGGKAEHGVYAPVPYGKLDSSHVHALDKEYFGNCSEWNGFLYGIGPRWKKTIDKWFLDPLSLAHPVLVVRYEDLKRDHVKEVKRMLDFLKFAYDEKSLAERLAKKASSSESFHRNHTDSNFEHFTTEQKKYINSLLQDTIQLLKQRGVEQLFNLHEYFR